MKRALLLTCAIGALCSQPANAATWTSWLSWAVTTARRAGVEVLAPDTCPPGHSALYAPRTRTIAICPDAIRRGNDYIAESLAHEAVHAAQHCLGIRLGTGVATPIGAWMASTHNDHRLLNLAQKAIYAKGDVISASSRGKPHVYLTEAEAYAIEAYPTQAIQILAAACQ